MKIVIYAGSLRPGGGLTVLKNIVDGLAKYKANQIIVYSGARDSSTQISKLSELHENVIERRFRVLKTRKHDIYYPSYFFFL